MGLSIEHASVSKSTTAHSKIPLQVYIGTPLEPHNHPEDLVIRRFSEAVTFRCLARAWSVFRRTLRGLPLQPSPGGGGEAIASSGGIVLPVDVIKIIVGIVYNDEEFAVNRAGYCALVSRSWRQGARPYVFRRIAIRDQRTLEAFHTLLRKQPDVKGFVQELRFGENRFKKRPWPHNSKSTWVDKALLPLSHILPMVHTIQFSQQFLGIREEAKPSDELFQGLAGFASVTRLVLRRCGCLEDFVFRCARILPRLRHLDVRAPDWHPYVMYPFPDDRIFWKQSAYPMALDALRLSTLRLSDGGRWEGNMLMWLLTSPHRNSLIRLRVDVGIWVTKVPAAIVELGPSLEELELDFNCPLPTRLPNPLASGVLLRTCTALRVLALHMWDGYTVKSAVELLEHVPSPRLERVTLRLRQSNYDHHLPTLTDLGAVLASEKFLRVHAIDFGYVGGATREKVWGCLEDAMPARVMRKIIFAHKVCEVCDECEYGDGITEGRCGHSVIGWAPYAAYVRVPWDLHYR